MARRDVLITDMVDSELPGRDMYTWIDKGMKPILFPVIEADECDLNDLIVLTAQTGSFGVKYDIRANCGQLSF